MSESISRRQAFKIVAKQVRFLLVLPIAHTVLSALAPAGAATTTARPKGEEMNLDDTPGSVDPYRLPRHIIPNRYDLRLEPDLATDTFAGKETIGLTVTQATSTIILNAVDLAISSAKLEGSISLQLEATIALEDQVQRCYLMFPQAIPPGEWRLHLTFQGKLNDHLRGFYRSTYKDAAGVTHTMAATQFEATDARRAFPCWDEPGFKAVFASTLVIDPALTAVSNTRIASERREGHRKVIAFADTIKMSTYLVAFVVGELESTTPV